jgi:hypothetical protein
MIITNFLKPAYMVFDTFNDVENTVLSNHQGEIGTPWIQHSLFPGDIYSIQSNRAVKQTATATAVYYATTVPGSLNHTIECDVVDIGSENRASGIGMCINTSSDHGIYVRRQNATTWQLIKIISGVGTSIETVATSFNQNVSTNLKLIRIGNDFWMYVGGVVSTNSPHQITDAQFQSIGRVGLRASNNHMGTGYHIDNFKCY